MAKATIKTEATKGLALPWKDCECGCHGNTLRLGSFFYWHIYYLGSKTCELRENHGMGERLGSFKTHAEMNDHIRTIAKPRLEQEKIEVDKALALLSSP